MFIQILQMPRILREFQIPVTVWKSTTKSNTASLELYGDEKMHIIEIQKLR